MRFFSVASSLLAGLSVISASSVINKRGEVTTIVEQKIVYVSCEKIKPKVFIISMV